MLGQQGPCVLLVANTHACSSSRALFAKQMEMFQMFRRCRFGGEKAARRLGVARPLHWRKGACGEGGWFAVWSVCSHCRRMQMRLFSDLSGGAAGVKRGDLAPKSTFERASSLSQGKEGGINFRQKEDLPLPFIARGRCMPGQRLLPCKKEDTQILARCQGKYVSPQEVEGGIVVRVISAKEAENVSSPVLRVVRNRQFGIRKGERTQLALFGCFFVCAFATLGFWQLRRMEEKKEIIAHRRRNLAAVPTVVESSPFPWTLEAASLSRQLVEESSLSDPCPPCEPSCLVLESDFENSLENSLENSSHCRISSESLLANASPEGVSLSLRRWSYRPVTVRGVLDSSTELFVGPRAGLEVGTPGFCVVSPLRLSDGSVLLVNKGHLSAPLAKLPPFQRESQNKTSASSSFSAHRESEELSLTQRNGDARLPYLHSGLSQKLENLQLLLGARDEPVDLVTVRGVLEPGELVNSTFKAFLIKNRPQDSTFLTVHPKDLASATPGVPNFTECSLMMLNAYSIVYDRDLDRHPDETNASTNTQTNSALTPDASTSQPMQKPTGKVRNRFASYQQKQKDDYLLFYADEHTHFNYACQWFLMGMCTAAMTIYKLIEVSRWRW